MSRVLRLLLVLSAIPLLSLALSLHTQKTDTEAAQQEMLADLERATDLSAEQKATLTEQVSRFDYAEFVLERCGTFGQDADAADTPTDLCWYGLQPIWAVWVGVVMLGLIAVATAVVTYSLRLASRGPAYELRGMRLGWNALRTFAGPYVVGQAALATFLAFWITAVYGGFYSVRLIAGIAALSLVGVFASFKALAHRPTRRSHVHGVVLEPDEAPRFHERLKRIADHVPTAPPDNVVLGIDDNFFVTEVPMVVSDQFADPGQTPPSGALVQGRTLFVSVALMDVLEAEESEAVLAHELGHLAAGDTQRSAGLVPMLQRCEAYVDAIDGSFTFGVAAAFEAYIDSFRRIHAGSSRAAELDADATAARCVGPDPVAAALIKVTAYAAYRTQQEDELLNAMSEHAELDIPARVRDGFAGLLSDEDFRESIATDAIPHPYDSHPPLRDRLEALGATPPDEYSARPLAEPPRAPLTDTIPEAKAAEERLWERYQRRFARAHRELIALRLRPTTPEEVARLELEYPPRTFETTDGRTTYRIDWEGVRIDDRSIRFDDVLELFEDHRELTIAVEGEVYPKIALAPLRPHAREFSETLARYLHRHQTAADGG